MAQPPGVARSREHVHEGGDVVHHVAALKSHPGPLGAPDERHVPEDAYPEVLAADLEDAVGHLPDRLEERGPVLVRASGRRMHEVRGQLALEAGDVLGAYRLEDALLRRAQPGFVVGRRWAAHRLPSEHRSWTCTASLPQVC